MSKPMSLQDWALLLLLSLLWGGSFFFVEIALRGLPMFSVVWLRVSVAAVLLALWLAAQGAAFPRGAAVWRALIGMGLLNNVIPFSLFAFAQGQISGGLAAILNATTPLWGVVLAHLFTTEKITLPRALGLGLGFSGVVVMFGGAAIGGLWAGAACLAAAFCYGLTGLWGRRFRNLAITPQATALGQLCCSSMMLLPVWLWQDQPWTMALPNVPVIVAILGLATLSTALAYLIFFRLLATAGPTNLLLVTFLIPISASALGWAVLGQAVALNQFAGFAMIAAGLAAIDGRVLKWR